ncbi:MAG: hypothetical protein C4309_09160, partial [Chloroflexota bacterium]
MRTRLYLFLALILAISLSATAQGARNGDQGPGNDAPSPAFQPPLSDKIDPDVLERLKQDGQADVLVLMSEQADTSGANALKTKGWYVYTQLTEVAKRTQADLLTSLRAQNIPYQSFWVYNMVHLSAPADVIAAIANRSEVQRIVLNQETQLDVIISPPPPLTDRLSTVEWNIAWINADDVWNQFGVTGAGAVVGDLDTGVQWDHPALK